jgi:hypothetical protein
MAGQEQRQTEGANGEKRPGLLPRLFRALAAFWSRAAAWLKGVFSKSGKGGKWEFTLQAFGKLPLYMDYITVVRTPEARQWQNYLLQIAGAGGAKIPEGRWRFLYRAEETAPLVAGVIEQSSDGKREFPFSLFLVLKSLPDSLFESVLYHSPFWEHMEERARALCQARSIEDWYTVLGDGKVTVEPVIRETRRDAKMEAEGACLAGSGEQEGQAADKAIPGGGTLPEGALKTDAPSMERALSGPQPGESDSGVAATCSVKPEAESEESEAPDPEGLVKPESGECALAESAPEAENEEVEEPAEVLSLTDIEEGGPDSVRADAAAEQDLDKTAPPPCGEPGTGAEKPFEEADAGAPCGDSGSAAEENGGAGGILQSEDRAGRDSGFSPGPDDTVRLFEEDSQPLEDRAAFWDDEPDIIRLPERGEKLQAGGAAAQAASLDSGQQGTFTGQTWPVLWVLPQGALAPVVVARGRTAPADVQNRWFNLGRA